MSCVRCSAFVWTVSHMVLPPPVRRTMPPWLMTASTGRPLVPRRPAPNRGYIGLDGRDSEDTPWVLLRTMLRTGGDPMTRPGHANRSAVPSRRPGPRVARLARLAHASSGSVSTRAWQDRPVTTRPAEEERLRDLARLRRVRDRIDREYAQPLDVEALARGVHMSAGHLSREFRLAYGESPYGYLMTRRIERAMALLRRGGS